jgi:hypothetical protein
MSRWTTGRIWWHWTCHVCTSIDNLMDKTGQDEADECYDEDQDIVIGGNEPS